MRRSRLAGASAGADGEKWKKWRNPPPTPQHKASGRNQMARVLTFAGRLCQGRDGHGIFKKKRRERDSYRGSKSEAGGGQARLFEGKIEKWIAKFWQLRKHRGARRCAGAVCFDAGEGAEGFKRS